MSGTVRLLIIHPNAVFGRYVAAIAQDLGYDVAISSRSTQFAESIAVFGPDVIVCPLVDRGFDALHLFQHLSAGSASPSLVILNSAGTDGTRLMSRLGDVYGIDCRMMGAAPSPLDLTAVLGEEHVARCGTMAPRLRITPDLAFSAEYTETAA